MVIVLPGERPISWNKLYDGKSHWSFRQSVAEETHRMVQKALSNMAAKPFDCPVVIEIVCYMKTPLYDADNVCTKMYIDGLKKYSVKKLGPGKFFKKEQTYWVIEDDNPSYVTAVASGVIRDNDNPRVEIYIKPYEEKNV